MDAGRRGASGNGTPLATRDTATGLSNLHVTGRTGSDEGRHVIPDPFTFPIWLNLALFAASGAIIWVTGTRLARYAESISDRTGLGHAVVGVFILALATSLPEIASVVTTASGGNAPLAVNNLLGGVVLQTAIRAVADRVSGREALTHFVARAVLLLEGLLVVVLLTVTLTGIGVGDVETRLGCKDRRHRERVCEDMVNTTSRWLAQVDGGDRLLTEAYDEHAVG